MQQVGAAVNDRRGHVLSRLDTADFNGVSCMFEQEAVTEKKKKKRGEESAQGHNIQQHNFWAVHRACHTSV